MRIKFLLIIALLNIGFTMQSSAQQYHSSSKRAIKQFHIALSHFDNNENELALGFINKAIGADKNFVEAYMMKAQILKDQLDFDGAIQNFHLDLVFL